MKNNFIAIGLIIATTVMVQNSVAQYQIDDGSADFSVGIPGAIINWGNSFTTLPGAERLETLEFGFGITNGSLVGEEITWTVFSDTDLDPTNGGLVVLGQGQHEIQNDNFLLNGIVDVIDVSDLGIVLEGDFFVSANFVDAIGSSFPATIDTTSPLSGRSFFSADPDPTQYAGGASTEAAGIPGNWVVRATATAIPEPTSAFLLIGFSMVAVVRRTK